MLPPSPPTLFLCSPLAPSPVCKSYHPTAAATVTHLLASHAEIPALIAQHGRLRVQSLPVPVAVHPPTAPGGTTVWFCPCCPGYHASEAALLTHLRATGAAAAITDLAGQQGLRRYLTDRCQRVLVPLRADTNDDDAAIDAAVAAAVAPAVRPAPAPAPVRIRVHFSAPYTRVSGLVYLAVPTRRALARVLDAEYAHLGGAGAVRWDERWQKGVVVRYDLRGGAGGRKDVWQTDADVGRDFADMVGVEAFVGDRKELGGVSAR